MKQHIALLLMFHISVFCNPVLVHREEIENIRTDDGRDIKIQYFISQHCDIENNQSNKMSTPLIKPETNPTATKEKNDGWSYKSLLAPISISSLGCIGYGIYYTYSKFSLFSLGTSCLQTAGWSMWKQKK